MCVFIRNWICSISWEEGVFALEMGVFALERDMSVSVLL